MAVSAALTIPGYSLGDEAGRGGFGVVHLATTADGTPVAIKVLHRRMDEVTRRRFNTEIQVMGTLAWHPNIVQILDAGDVDDHAFIVMERLDGGTLGDVVDDEGPLSPAAAIVHGVEAAGALHIAHRAGVLHRDVKPDNLLLGGSGQIKLSDFGVALSAVGLSEGEDPPGASGTVAFSAPELLDGQSATVASDVYALGATLYALLAGRAAYHEPSDESPAALIVRCWRDPVPDLAEQGVPEPLARVVRRAMAKDPAGRPASAEDLVKELRGAGEALGIAVALPAGLAREVGTGAPPAALQAPGPATAGPPPRQRARTNRLQRITSALAGVAAVMVGIAFFNVADPFGGEEDAAPPAVEAPADPEDAGDADGPDDAVVPTAAEEEGESDLSPAPAEPAPPVAPSAVPTPSATALPPAEQPETAGDSGVPLDEPGQAVAGSGDLVVVASANALIAVTDGQVSAAVQATGVRAIAVGTGVVATSSGDTVHLRDPTLAVTATIDLAATDLAIGSGDVVHAATPQGLVRLDGTEVVSVAPQGTQHVAAGGGVVWAADRDGTLILDDGTGQTRVHDGLGGQAPVALAVDADASALVVTADGSLVRVRGDGSAARIGEVSEVVDVAATDAGVVWVLDRAGRAHRVGGDTAPVEQVTAIAPSGGAVWAITVDPPAVRRLEG